MKFSFDMLLEAMENASSPLMDSGEETKSMQVIRAGLSLRNDHSFWDDFIQLCSNSDGLADLLGVRKESVTSWASKIKQTIEDVEKHNQHDNQSEKDKIIPTGETGAITDKNMGPFGKISGQ